MLQYLYKNSEEDIFVIILYKYKVIIKLTNDYRRSK